VYRKIRQDEQDEQDEQDGQDKNILVTLRIISKLEKNIL